MRWAPCLFLVLSGCGTTVYRQEGPAVAPGGLARNSCESVRWLVIAPTSAEIARQGSATSKREDGVGLYRVGAGHPEAITDLEALPPSAMVERKRDEVSSYDGRKVVATGLGVAGLVAIGVGTALFVSAFESKMVLQNGTRREETGVNATRAGVGGAVVGLGFGLGISGLVVNPGHAERTRANASRFVFMDPPDRHEDVEELVEAHNVAAREACAR
jgi:hypothetical protein